MLENFWVDSGKMVSARYEKHDKGKLKQKGKAYVIVVGIMSCHANFPPPPNH